MRQEYTYNDVSYFSRNISNIKSRQSDTINLNINYKIGLNTYSSFPMFSSPMKDVSSFEMSKILNKYESIGIIHRFMDFEIWKLGIFNLLKENKLNVFSFSVSLNDYDNKLDWIEFLINSNEIQIPNAIIICLDLANASSELIKKPIKRFYEFKKNYYNTIDIEYLTGNIVTSDAAWFIYDNGFKFIRIGIGSGSVCSTPIETGFFRPPFSAMEEIVNWKHKNNINDLYLIADGGISDTATMIKAMGIGADGFMLGRLLAGWEFSSGDINIFVDENGNEIKKSKYSGSASQEIANITNNLNKIERRIISEGVSDWINYRGGINEFDNWLFQVRGGMRSALSYSNSLNWEDFRNNIEFVLNTAHSYKQQHPNISWK